MAKSLKMLHEDVPADYYDRGIKRVWFQRYWHRKRFSEVRKFTAGLDGRLLDIGCHSGLFTKHLIQGRKFSHVYGIDISPDAIRYAKKRIKKGVFRVGDAHTLPFKDNYFDTLFCLEMLEHTEHPKKVVAEIARVLKPGGIGIILVPTDSLLFRVIWFMWNMYQKAWHHTHVQSFNATSVAKVLKQQKLTVLEVKHLHLGMLLLVKFSR